MEPKKEEIDEEKVKKLFLEKSTKLKTSPPKNIKFDNNQKLKFYGLYKVSTIGKYSENNKLKAGFFDFETKYKNQAWEKCSIYSPIEAMIEYIKYYCELTGEKCDLNFSKNKISINDLSLDIPNLESQSLYSSNAKESLLEKEKFLEKASLEEKKFQSLKDDIYNGELITEEILNKFESDNKINLLSFRDTIGQSILHVAVDAISFSAVDSLIKMRDLGNTLIVVEHDEDTMRASDYLVDIGPGAGDAGGEVVAKGTPKEAEKNENSITGMYLSGKKSIPVPKERRKGIKKYLKIKGAEEHNLKNIDVDIPLGTLTCVTGVSGSGKSSLITEILCKAISKELNHAKEKPGKYKKILGIENIDKIVVISQSPIGRTPRSNPATYTGVFDDIRALFTTTKEAKMLGFEKNRFSFNVKGGRCEACRGDGIKKIEMHFLPDVYVPWEVCHGTRYNKETLNIKYKDKNIAEVLDMRVTEALEFFSNIPKIKHKLQVLHDVGLGYIKLGQSAPTLSGGEAERVKLAKELQKKATGKTLFVLDEPTTGLHTDDISRLLAILQKIVDNKDTVIVIEHNLDVIKVADYIIDLGPDGGDLGGKVVATGTPEEIAKVSNSYTGQFLKRIL